MEKEKSNEKNRLSRWGLSLIWGAIVLVVSALIYTGAVLLENPEASQDDSWAVIDDEEALTPLQAASLSDVSALARLFGAPLPAFSGLQPLGEARNTTHDGRLVRMVTLKYDGAEIIALRPASAAPLLLEEGMSLSLRSDLTAINLPAVLAEGKGRYRLYFSSNQAAYALAAPAESAEEFLALVRRLVIVP